MRPLAAIALGAGILATLAGCSLLRADSIAPDPDFGATICQETRDGVDEVVTGIPFVVPADNSEELGLGSATLLEPVNIELVDAYIVRDGSLSGGTLLPEDIDESFESVQGAMVAPTEGGFSLAVHVRTLDPTAPATFDGVRLTYADDDAKEYSVEMATDVTLAPDCGLATS